MADTTTTHYEFVKPQIGGSTDTWGTKLNENFDELDTELKAVSDAADAAQATADTAETAVGTSYDNTTSGLTATDVQAAIDEIDALLDLGAAGVPYDNATSALVATDVQAAIDEVAAQTKGRVLQVQSVTKTDIFSTTSGSYVDVTGLAVTITPSSIDNKVLVIANVAWGNSVNNSFVQLVRGSTAIGNGAGGFTGGRPSSAASSQLALFAGINFLDSPASVSALTYKVQVQGDGTTYINRRGFSDNLVWSSHITVMEIEG